MHFLVKRTDNILVQGRLVHRPCYTEYLTFGSVRIFFNLPILLWSLPQTLPGPANQPGLV